jgi:hypothetical protein
VALAIFGSISCFPKTSNFLSKVVKEAEITDCSFSAKCETIEAIRVTADCLFRRTFAPSKQIDNEKSIHHIIDNQECCSYGTVESDVSDIEQWGRDSPVWPRRV